LPDGSEPPATGIKTITEVTEVVVCQYQQHRWKSQAEAFDYLHGSQSGNVGLGWKETLPFQVKHAVNH